MDICYFSDTISDTKGIMETQQLMLKTGEKSYKRYLWLRNATL